MISRFDTGKDFRPRLLSTLARQLERYRELLPLWAEQRKAISCIMEQTERTLDDHKRKAAFLLEERERLDRVYNQKYEALVAHLSKAQGEVATATQNKKNELKKELEDEHEITERLRCEEAKNKALQNTLDQTVSRLSSVRDELQQCQAAVASLTGPQKSSMRPELALAAQRAEATRQEREEVRSQTLAARQESERYQDESKCLKQNIEKMEAFLRRLATSAQYNIDKKTKRDAQKLLDMSKKRAQSPKGHRASRPSSASRPGTRPTSASRSGTACATEAPSMQGASTAGRDALLAGLGLEGLA